MADNKRMKITDDLIVGVLSLPPPLRQLISSNLNTNYCMYAVEYTRFAAVQERDEDDDSFVELNINVIKRNVKVFYNKEDLDEYRKTEVIDDDVDNEDLLEEHCVQYIRSDFWLRLNKISPYPVVKTSLSTVYHIKYSCKIAITNMSVKKI